ncbi:hypothetical protein JNB91_17345 [Rhizobium wenxiniae]|uniref:hypothetical protein n=1 Tax=Rhizobium wenxiniae TaxID=1737357 RepID=UPI001C6EB91C|nr:hypothetical protein [Rhizobium wenxiniae]MBW9089591.1 hypothetical protein [Rhizobium wenxiniae]
MAAIDPVHRLCGGFFDRDFEENVRIARQSLKHSLNQIVSLWAREVVTRGVTA